MKNLIELPYLNEACFLSENIDPKKYQMVLNLAQESLRDVLGGEFYEQIETQYDPSLSTGTLSVDNAALYEGYIKDFLAWHTYLNLLGFSQSDMTPTGDRGFKDDNSELLTDIKMASKEGNVRRWANHYKYKMINFLTLEQSKTPGKYPLYKGHCREEFSWAISSVSRNSYQDKIISMNRAVRDNE